MYLQLNSVNKFFEYGKRETIRDFSIEVGKGEFICLVGPSGCGKSTILNLIAGLTPLSSGTIVLDGRPISGPGPDRIMMFQEAALFPWLNVMKNVMFGLDAAGHSKKEQQQIAERYLRMVRLWNYRNYPIHQLSGGMKQRVSLARALALDSKLLLMDEPFSALDKQTINVLREELEQIWETNKKTILYVTHSVEEAVYFADRVVVMSENPGRIQEIIPIGLPRPRKVENADFVTIRHRILQSVRAGVNKSMSNEFDPEVDR